MAFILGVFDLLAYAIPGLLYLTTFAYVASRAGWIDVPSVLDLPSLMLLIALAVAGFLTGQAAHPLGRVIDRVNRSARKNRRRRPGQNFSAGIPVPARDGSFSWIRSHCWPPSRRMTGKPLPTSFG